MWIDAAGTGIRADNSEGLNGVKVELFNMQSLSTTPVSTVTTQTQNNVTGCYNFTNIDTGFYRIRVSLPEDSVSGNTKTSYSFTEPNKTNDLSRASVVSKSDGYTASFSYTKGQDLQNQNAGLVRTTAAAVSNSISGYVWFDQNANGRREDGETHLSGVTVNLYLSDDMSRYVKTTTTNSSGYYEFTNITSDNIYRVKVSLPSAATQAFTKQNAQNGDRNDSRVDSSGLSGLLGVSSTSKHQFINAGIAPKDSVTPTPTIPTESFPFIGAAKPKAGDATVPMRQTTSTSAPIFKSIQPGDQVVVIGYTIDTSNRIWYKVLGYSYDGVIMKDLITKVEVSSLNLPRKARIFIPKDSKAPKAALRAEPRRASAPVGNLWMESGVSITIVGVEKGWYKIDVNGLTGYIEPCQMRYAE